MGSLNLTPYLSKSLRVAEASGPMEPVAFLLTEPTSVPHGPMLFTGQMPPNHSHCISLDAVA